MKLTTNDSYVYLESKNFDYEGKTYHQAIFECEGYKKSFNVSENVLKRMDSNERYKLIIDYDKFYDKEKKVFNHKIKLVDVIKN